MLCFTTVVSAKAEDRSATYDKELETAVISGSGTFEDPYIVDYSKAPGFTEFVNESYDSAMSGEYNVTTRNTGFTGYSLDQYRGVYSNGGEWVYSSGGLSPAVDGNVKFSRITYSNHYTALDIKNSRADTNFFDIIQYLLSKGVSLLKPQITSAVKSAMSSMGVQTIAGMGYAKLAAVICSAIGATATILGVPSLLSLLRSTVTDYALNDACDSGKNYVYLYYSTSYHGAWYANSSAEAGWTGNRIYTPNPGYGSGSFFSY